MSVKATGKDIREAVGFWQEKLGLTDWQFHVRIGRIAGGHRATAETDWHYKEAWLCFDPSAMHKHKDDLHEIVCHEITHTVLHRGHEAAQKRAKNGIDEANLEALEENEVTIVSRMFVKLVRP